MRTGGRDDFQTKAALYDELFSRGWRESAVAITHYDRVPDEVRDAEAFLHQAAADLVGWAMAHPAYAQLMFWRPVPNWQPSPSAYAPAVEMVERLSEVLGELQRRRLLRPDVDLTEATDAWTVLVNGLISQQLANEPGGSLESGRYTRLIRPLVQAVLLQYGAKSGRRRPSSR